MTDWTDLERSLVDPGLKSWTLKGEASAKDRARDSLLEEDIILPQFKRYKVSGGDGDSLGLETGGEDDDATSERNFESRIEEIVKRRILNRVFDDVVRIDGETPAVLAEKKGDKLELLEELNFKKSSVGLADIYAKEYEDEYLGGKANSKSKEDLEKSDIMKLFSKVMHSLDSLTNQHFIPKSVHLMSASERAARTGIAAIEVEETIPLTLQSTVTQRAPHEILAKEGEEKKRKRNKRLRSPQGG